MDFELPAQRVRLEGTNGQNGLDQLLQMGHALMQSVDRLNTTLETMNAGNAPTLGGK